MDHHHSGAFDCCTYPLLHTAIGRRSSLEKCCIRPCNDVHHLYVAPGPTTRSLAIKDMKQPCGTKFLPCGYLPTGLRHVASQVILGESGRQRLRRLRHHAPQARRYCSSRFRFRSIHSGVPRAQLRSFRRQVLLEIKPAFRSAFSLFDYVHFNSTLSVGFGQNNL